MPALLTPLAVRVVSATYAGPAVLVTAGAFSVGFGAFHQLQGSRLKPMLLAAGGMCVSSWIGTLAAPSAMGTVAVIAAAGLVYGRVSLEDAASSWVALQCAVWLIISTAYPAAGIHILSRGALIFAGGLLQIAVVFLLWRLIGTANPILSTPVSAETHHHRPFPIRALITLAVAAALYRNISVMNGYWIPMTAVIVIRPGLEEMLQRGFARILGTMIGAAVATLIANLTHGISYVSALLVLLFAWICYSVIWVNYAAFALSLTSYVVFLLSLAGVEENALILHRVAFTLIGGTVAFIGHAVFRGWVLHKTHTS